LRAFSRSIRGTVEHHGEKGRGHEQALSNELQRLFPARIAIKTGSILGAQGTISRQIDLILCDLQNYPAFSYEAGTLLLPDSVLGVISVKTTLRTSEVPTYFAEAADLKRLMHDALGGPWAGFYAVIGFWLEGTATSLVDRYHAGVLNRPAKRMGVDLIAALDKGPLCLDLSVLAETEGEPPDFLATRAHVLGIAFDACTVDSTEPFVDAYKLMITALDSSRLARIMQLAAPVPGVRVQGGFSSDPAAYRATFAGKSGDIRLAPGQTGNFQTLYANTGTASWRKGSPTEARLVVAGPRGHVTPQGWESGWLSETTYGAQIQEDVGPGGLATFSFNVRAPGDARPGHYRFYARPQIRDIGALTKESRANGVEVVPPSGE
jgi:hypothetical protein